MFISQYPNKPDNTGSMFIAVHSVLVHYKVLGWSSQTSGLGPSENPWQLLQTQAHTTHFELSLSYFAKNWKIFGVWQWRNNTTKGPYAKVSGWTPYEVQQHPIAAEDGSKKF